MGFTSSNMSNWNLSSRANDNVGQEHYDAIRSDSNDENWAFFAYDYKSKKEVAVSGSGSGDIREFFLLAWVPEEGANKLPIMVKGNMSVHKASFKEIFRDFNSEFTFGSEEDLNAEAVMNTIIKAGG